MIILALLSIAGSFIYYNHMNTRGLENEIKAIKQANEEKSPLVANRTLYVPQGYKYINTIGDIMVYIDESSITSIKLNKDVLDANNLKDYPIVYDMLYISPREKDFSYLFMTDIIGLNKDGRCVHKELQKIAKVGDYRHAKEITRSETKFAESSWQVDSKASAFQKCLDYAAIYVATNDKAKVSYILPE